VVFIQKHFQLFLVYNTLLVLFWTLVTIEETKGPSWPPMWCFIVIMATIEGRGGGPMPLPPPPPFFFHNNGYNMKKRGGAMALHVFFFIAHSCNKRK
jgi:hypothetical protein